MPTTLPDLSRKNRAQLEVIAAQAGVVIPPDATNRQAIALIQGDTKADIPPVKPVKKVEDARFSQRCIVGIHAFWCVPIAGGKWRCEPDSFSGPIRIVKDLEELAQYADKPAPSNWRPEQAEE